MGYSISSYIFCLKIGYIPNEIAIFHRDNDQQNHWVQWGTRHFQTNPFVRFVHVFFPDKQNFALLVYTPNVSIYTIHGSYGYCYIWLPGSVSSSLHDQKPRSAEALQQGLPETHLPPVEMGETQASSPIGLFYFLASSISVQFWSIRQTNTLYILHHSTFLPLDSRSRTTTMWSRWDRTPSQYQ